MMDQPIHDGYGHIVIDEELTPIFRLLLIEDDTKRVDTFKS
ncbi:hypothetical protein [Thiolapillus sp.]